MDASFVKRPVQVKLILDSDGQYDCNESKRAEIFVNRLAANRGLDESTNSFANRPTKHIILAILTAKNKAANLSLDDSKKREWLFYFSLKLSILLCLDLRNSKKWRFFDIELSI